MRLRALIFDFDGTIAETERLGHRVAYNAAFAEAGLPWVWDEREYGELLAIGGGKERIAHYIATTAPPGVPDGDRAAFIEGLHARKQRHFGPLAPTIAIRPGVRRLIAAARTAGIVVAIATTAAPAGVDALIANDAVLRDAFALVAAGDIVARKKPAPDIYRYTLERLGVEAAVAIAIEDSTIGTASALAAGLTTLVTVSDYTRGETFSGAAAVVTNLGEPGSPAQTLAGPPPPDGVVDLAYLETLLDR